MRRCAYIEARTPVCLRYFGSQGIYRLCRRGEDAPLNTQISALTVEIGFYEGRAVSKDLPRQTSFFILIYIFYV